MFQDFVVDSFGKKLNGMNMFVLYKPQINVDIKKTKEVYNFVTLISVFPSRKVKFK